MESTWRLKSIEEMSQIRQLAENQHSIIKDNDDLEETASFFQGLADPTRLKIISLLWLEDLCMCEIVSAIGGANSTISHHLKIMEKGGVIESRREGKFTIYRVNKDKLSPIISLLNKKI